MPKVLIADDSIAVRKVAERLLTEAGFGVTLAANGEEALAYLAKETPDLVVSDVIMPDKSGYEVCAFVRAQRALANTPVLLISGIVNDEVTRQAESCHADGVLKKPFQGTSLKDRVLELLAKRQGAATPAAKNIERVTESFDEPIQSARVSNEQLEIYRQAVARLKTLEEELRVERDRATRSTQRVSQLEGQLGSVKEFESVLAGERERIARLKQQLAEVDSATARVQDLEAALAKEREGSAQQAMRLAELQKSASRVQELEATLHAERQAAAQLVEQMTEMERAVTRSQELAEQLAQEQERTSELTRRVAEGEQIEARASRFEQALAAEQDKSKGLAARLSEAERAAQNAREFETLLQTERDRNSLLARRVSETEQASEQATKRFEEMATKLGEIAGLASQLGSGKRRP
ncbi:MAG TPA: response regulator [Nitrospiraceae bacterium]|nr:response regulator [Nitrospiraceae bacterium]